MKLFSIEGTFLRLVVYIVLSLGFLIFTPWYLPALFIWLFQVIDTIITTWVILKKNRYMG